VRFQGFASVVASTALLVAGIATEANAFPFPVTGLAVGDEKTVVSGLVDPNNLSGTATFMQFPFVESFPSASGGLNPRVVLLSYSEQVDSGALPERLRTLRSADGGKTFTSLASDVPITSMKQLADGSLVAVNFRTARMGVAPAPGPLDLPLGPTATVRVPRTKAAAAPPPGDGAKTFQTTYWRSRDYGLTWAEQNGTISAAQSYDALYFHRGIVVGLDGALLATTYGYLDGDPRYRSMLARSTDGGANWRIVSTIATSPPGLMIEGRSEPTMARTAARITRTTR